MGRYVILLNEWLNIKYFKLDLIKIKTQWEFFNLEKYSDVLGEYMHIIIQENPEKEELSGRIPLMTLK